MPSALYDIKPLLEFLPCATPDAWIAAALQNFELLLIDHANCEKKAASTALTMLFRYPDKKQIVKVMSPLAREELLHFEKVCNLLESYGIDYKQLAPGRYATELHRHASKAEPERLVDLLVIGAFIEARSCERFYRLAPQLDAKLQDFYFSLVKAEARHFEEYLNLAQAYATTSLQPKLIKFAKIEEQLICSNDTVFRFHSGSM